MRQPEMIYPSENGRASSTTLVKTAMPATRSMRASCDFSRFVINHMPIGRLIAAVVDPNFLP